MSEMLIKRKFFEKIKNCEKQKISGKKKCWLRFVGEDSQQVNEI